MQMSELRREVAPLVGLTDGTLRILQQGLYGVAEFQAAGLKGRAGDVGDRGLLVTNSSSALVILAGMLGKDRETIGARVLQLWQAQSISRTGNPLERCKTLGAALTRFLARADVREHLDYIELDRDIPDMTVVLDKGSRVVFSPLKPKQWTRRMEAMFARGTVTDVRRLPRTTFDKVAALIAADQEAERKLQ
jgi:hypothetical protein